MIGKNLGHYEITRLLGKGGMGEVYQARDAKLDRDVALKILPRRTASDPLRKARFAREARALAALNHPNIVTIHSVEDEVEIPFLTMELVQGTDLGQQIPEGGMALERALRLAIQMTEALTAANEVGITHRDLKPGNVMVTPADQVKLLDFGLAKVGQESDVDITLSTATALTTEGAILGTVAYMSPEQLEGKPADHRSDLFALGIILFEMATGSKPFQGGTPAAVLSAILRDPPASVLESRPDLPAELDRIIATCLRKHPDQRYQTAQELQRELEALAELLAFESGTHVARNSHEADAASPPPAIAVLPFVDLSQAGDQEYFCDGMTEEIINALTSVQGVRVAARTSSFRFKGQEKDVRAIGRELNVDLVLEGSVRTAGNRLRVTAQLINVADGYHIWSERYSRLMEDVFEIQDEISASIVSTLKTTIGDAGKASASRRHSDNIDAYHFYLRGRHCWNRRHQGVLPKAIEHFRRAIDDDPEYALAYSGLADSYSVLGYYGFERPESAFRRATAAAKAALKLDPDQAEAHTSLAYVQHHFDWNLEAADANYRRAIELKPSYAVAHQWRALLLTCMGRADAAQREILSARDLDPLSPVINTAVGWIHYLCGKIDRALHELRAALELDPGFPWLSFVLGHTHLQAGNLGESEQYFRKAAEATDHAPFYLAGLGHCLAVAGREAASRLILQEMMGHAERDYASAEHLASALAHGDARFDELRREMAQGMHR
jgi:serine/threonine protein kinase/Tfp pilus assembly protein PilF